MTTTSRAARSVPWLVVAATVYVSSVVAMVAVEVPAAVTVVTAGVQLAMMGAGAAIAVRSDVPRLGWLLVATGATINFWTVVGEIPMTNDLAVLAHSMAPLSGLPFIIAVSTFPNARPVNRFGRWVVGLAVATGTTSVLLMISQTFDLIGGDWATYRQLFEVALVGTVVGTVVNHVRTWRSRPRVEQLQLKYFVLVLFVGFFQLWGSWAGVPGAVLLDSVMPGAISITILLAITRYRLYDIDRLVSRSVAYALVVASLGAVFVGGVALVSTLLPTQDRLAVVLTTLAVIALFDPLRRRVTITVDRRFDRTRYVARQVVEDFGRQVQDVTDLGEVREQIEAVLARTVAPASIAIWQPTTEVSS